MEYIDLLIACAFFALQFVFQKLFQNRTRGGLAVCLWNQVAFGTASVLFLLAKSGLPAAFNLTAFFYILAYTACGLTCAVGTIMAMGCGKVSVVSTFCLAGGMVIPFIYGIAALGEEAGLLKWLGIAVLCLSLVPSFLAKSDGRSGGGNKLRFAVWCIIVFLTNGLVSVFSKAHQISPASIGEDSFVFFSASLRLAAALGLILGIARIQRCRGEREVLRTAFWEIGHTPMTGKLFVLLFCFSAGLAVCNTLGNLFSLRCMLTMDASLQFPLLSAIVIVLSALFGRIFFGEKIARDTVISLALSGVGAALFAVA